MVVGVVSSCVLKLCVVVVGCESVREFVRVVLVGGKVLVVVL